MKIIIIYKIRWIYICYNLTLLPVITGLLEVEHEYVILDENNVADLKL
jgi:hypothetical protein